MAKTPKPLLVLVHPDLWLTPAVQDLRAKQNDVVAMTDYAALDGAAVFDYDLILGPNCWRIVPGLENQIPLAVAAARRLKYGKKGTDDGASTCGSND